MTTYTPDLELRRRVAEALIKGTDWEGNASWVDGWCTSHTPDISFDAIMELVRDVMKESPKQSCDVWHSLRYPAAASNTEFTFWLIETATPADYCRAYLAAKAEKKEAQ